MANSKQDYKSKGRKRSNTRSKAKLDKHDSERVKEPETLNGNDPEWYIRDTNMKTGLTRMPTFEFRGVDSEIGTQTDISEVTISVPTDTLASPTVAVHRVNPSPGVARNQNSPVNMAARMLYSRLSSSNAKTSNYAPQDVATLMLAIGEIISMITHYTRLYGITNFYNRMNRSIPDALLKAYGIRVQDIAEWTQYLPEFRAELNQLITIANSISFPANIPYFKKCAYVYQNIYIDDYSVMTAYHLMTPHSTWIVDEVSFDQGTILKTRVVDNPSATNFRNKLNTLREQIDAILTSTTYNYIYSDILNLATRNVLGSDLISFGTIPIDYVVEPILSDQFNWQLMNATIFGEPNGVLDISSGGTVDYTPNNDVYPDVKRNCLIYNPRWEGNAAFWYTNMNILEPIIRVPDVGVSEDDLIDMVAYTGSYVVEADGTSTTAYADSTIISCSIPDHYFIKSIVYYGNTSDERSGVEYPANNVGTVFEGSSPETRLQRLMQLSLVSEFQHFPLVYYYGAVNQNGEVYNPSGLRFSSRLGAYTLRMSKAVKNIRNASFLGLFTME